MRYKLIRQLPYCCVPACLAMVLKRRKIKAGSQEEIGKELGLIVPKTEAKYFKNVKTGKKPVAGFGTQVQLKRYSINNYCKKHRIKLVEKYYPIDKVKNFSEFISRNLKKVNDIMVCFNHQALYAHGNYGHVSLINKISDNKVTLTDPDYSKYRTVNLSKLIKAIIKHGKDKRAGFWVSRLKK